MSGQIANSARPVPDKFAASRYLPAQEKRRLRVAWPELYPDFDTAAPGASARFTTWIEPDNYVKPAVPEIVSVCSTLCAKPDHRACFSLQPSKIGVFVGVNTRSQILLANVFGVNRLAYPRWSLQSRVQIYRHYP
jgi:hypothetical protein